jgi:hypothetical protein
VRSAAIQAWRRGVLWLRKEEERFQKERVHFGLWGPKTVQGGMSGSAGSAQAAIRHEDTLLMELQQRRSADAKIVGHAAQAFTLIRMLEERLGEAGGGPSQIDGAAAPSLPVIGGGAFTPVSPASSLAARGPETLGRASMLEEQERANREKQRELERERQLLLEAQQRARAAETGVGGNTRQAETLQQRSANDMSVEEVLAMAQKKNAETRKVVNNRVRGSPPAHKTSMNVRAVAVSGQISKGQFQSCNHATRPPTHSPTRKHDAVRPSNLLLIPT